jgi:mannose-1-phosphate guanylyltransferase
MARNRDFEHAYAVIMAGGSGTRFWPLSRRQCPKQLLKLLGTKTLLEETVERIRNFIPPQRTYVFTNEILKAACARCLRGIPPSQIIAEPAARNTAPTIGLAAHEILRHDPDGLMVVLPSDHVIRKAAAFRRVLRAACRWASQGSRSVIVGLKPTRPETGYGYVKRGQAVGAVAGTTIFAVECFTEKPALDTAHKYLRTGRYLWNGGMFIWRASTLLHHLQRSKPGMARELAKLAAAGGAGVPRVFRRIFPRLEKVSVDYAVMEEITDCFVVEAEIGWSDVGSWAVVHELLPKDADGNVRPTNSLSLDSCGNMIIAPGRFVVTVGVENMVVVETEDALLVVPRNRSQDVGKAVQELERRGKKHLL